MEKATPTKKCARCGKEFEPAYPHERYCGSGCWAKNYQPKHICPICGRGFKAEHKGQVYCSVECRAKGAANSRRAIKRECTPAMEEFFTKIYNFIKNKGGEI